MQDMIEKDIFEEDDEPFDWDEHGTIEPVSSESIRAIVVWRDEIL